MSGSLSPAGPKRKANVSPQMMQEMLNENRYLIETITDLQSKGRTAECPQYMFLLEQNLVYLASAADSNVNIQSPLPEAQPPPMNVLMGEGFAASNMTDNVAGAPPTSTSQLINVPVLHQQPSGPRRSAAQAGGVYPGSSMMEYMNKGPSRFTQGSGLLYLGYEELLGGQYGSSKSSEPVTQQFNPDAQSVFSYQHTSYGEQSHNRPHGESSHYYKEGNPQFSQPPYQASSQQPFAAQQGYSGQSRGYVPMLNQQPSGPHRSAAEAGGVSPGSSMMASYRSTQGPGPRGAQQYSHHQSSQNQQQRASQARGSGPPTRRSYKNKGPFQHDQKKCNKDD